MGCYFSGSEEFVAKALATSARSAAFIPRFPVLLIGHVSAGLKGLLPAAQSMVSMMIDPRKGWKSGAPTNRLWYGGACEGWDCCHKNVGVRSCLAGTGRESCVAVLLWAGSLSLLDIRSVFCGGWSTSCNSHVKLR